MSFPQPPTSIVGFLVVVAGSIGGVASSLFKIAAQTIPPITPGLPAMPTSVDVTATNGLILSIAVGVLGLLTQIANGIFAGRKLRREVTEKMELAEARAIAAKAEADRLIADAKAEADRKIADAKSEADRKIADAKAESDRQHAKAEAERESAAERRKAEREFANTQILKLEEQVKELSRRSDYTEPRVDRNIEAVDVLAAKTHTVVPPIPPPDPTDAGTIHP